jgi:nucleoside-diphosphate-sugar epimerase
MKVLITGGSGFIGSRLVQLLCASGYRVRILSRKRKLSQGSERGLVDFVQADLLSSDCAFEEIVSGCSLVFNCTGEIREEGKMSALHVDATSRLIDACKKLAKSSGQPLHWVQLSSVGAYGPIIGNARAERIVTESTTPAPVGIYETTKTKADELLIAAEEEGVFSYSVLRPSNVFGAGMPNDSLRQWAHLIRRRLFFYVGSRKAISTYVHVNDVVNVLLLCGFDERAKGEIFNISNDCPQEQLVKAIAANLNVSAPNLCLPEWMVRFLSRTFSGVPGFPLTESRINSLVARTYYPSSKLESVLGYRLQYPVTETVAEILS